MNPRPPSNPPAAGRPAHRRLWLTRNDEDTGGGESFDALTDLFLGEVSRPRRESNPAPDAGDTPRFPPPASGPVLRLIPAEDSDSVDVETARPDVSSPSSVPPVPTEPTPAFVECLVVGNLPVMASAWASQYVREVAGAAGRPVAFVRVQAGFVTLELVGELADAEIAGQLPAADFALALRTAAGVTNRWVIRVDQSDESATAARSGMRLVTLITGSDEAARVHAYAALKDLADRLSQHGEPGPAVRVAVMSAPDAKAEDVGRKLVDTVRQFLARDVQHAVCSSRIRAARPAQMVFNGRLDLPTSMIIEQIEHTLELPASRAASLDVKPAPAMARKPPAAPPAEFVPDSTPALAAAAVDLEQPSPPPVVMAIAPEPAVAPPSRSAAAHEPAPTEPPLPAPAPPDRRVDDVALWSSAAVESKLIATHNSAALASYIAGIATTDIRCPYADSIELGVSEDGRMHLLARSAGPEDDDRVIGSLMVASAWVESHAALLKPVVPAFNPAAGAARLHLFTANPKASRRLLETDLRLHLLAPVSVAGQTGWYCTELN